MEQRRRGSGKGGEGGPAPSKESSTAAVGSLMGMPPLPPSPPQPQRPQQPMRLLVATPTTPSGRAFRVGRRQGRRCVEGLSPYRSPSRGRREWAVADSHAAATTATAAVVAHLPLPSRRPPSPPPWWMAPPAARGGPDGPEPLQPAKRQTAAVTGRAWRRCGALRTAGAYLRALSPLGGLWAAAAAVWGPPTEDLLDRRGVRAAPRCCPRMGADPRAGEGLRQHRRAGVAMYPTRVGTVGVR